MGLISMLEPYTTFPDADGIEYPIVKIGCLIDVEREFACYKV